MKTQIRTICAALAIGGFASMASAVAIDLSTGSGGFVNTPAAGAFSDVYTFSLGAATTLTGLVSSVVNGGQDVDFSSMTLTGPSGPYSFGLINPDPFEVWTISTPTLLPGAYTLTLVGSNSAAVGTYSGTLAISVVPEVETYALLLAGLGIVGFLALRRRS